MEVMKLLVANDLLRTAVASNLNCEKDDFAPQLLTLVGTINASFTKATWKISFRLSEKAKAQAVNGDLAMPASFIDLEYVIWTNAVNECINVFKSELQAADSILHDDFFGSDYIEDANEDAVAWKHMSLYAITVLGATNSLAAMRIAYCNKENDSNVFKTLADHANDLVCQECDFGNKTAF